MVQRLEATRIAPRFLLESSAVFAAYVGCRHERPRSIVSEKSKPGEGLTLMDGCQAFHNGKEPHTRSNFAVTTARQIFDNMRRKN